MEVNGRAARCPRGQSDEFRMYLRHLKKRLSSRPKLFLPLTLLAFAVLPGFVLLTRTKLAAPGGLSTHHQVEEVFESLTSHPNYAKGFASPEDEKHAEVCTNCMPAIVVFSLIRVDLLTAFLSSIDLVTEHVFAVCNFASEEGHGEMLKAVDRFSNCSSSDTETMSCENPNIRRVHVIASVENVGFAGSFNLVLKSLLGFRFPFVLFNNDDTRFLPGRLLAIKRIMTSTDACMYYFEGFSSFGISLLGVARLGPMDENFWPAYAEDCDYWFRAQLQNCSLYYRAGYSLTQRTNVGQQNAFVSHGHDHLLSGTTLASSSQIGVLVANTLDPKRGRFAYLARKWGFNSCDLYHDLMNTARNDDETLAALSEKELRDRGMKSRIPYGPHSNLSSVNSWLIDDWKQEGSVTPRGVNSKWAPNETVWQEEDELEFALFAKTTFDQFKQKA